MATKLLISEGKLKSFTNVNKNVDIDVIRAEINIAQDIQLQPLLGSKFYDHLLNQITVTGNTFNADELELVNEYISPFLIQVSYWSMIPHLHIRTMNRGLEIGQMESAIPADIETMKYLRGIQLQRADFYKMRLQDFLIIGRGQNKFPDYLNYNQLDGMLPDRGAGYRNPIFLNNTTRQGVSKDRFNRGSIQSYSDRAHYDGGCIDCM